MKLAIFDLDGVIVDTAKYHFLAWKRLAAMLGISFTEEDNERLKGVSRVRSLEIVLELGGLEKSQTEMEELAQLKNTWYVDYINQLTAEEILPGVLSFLRLLDTEGIKTALCSASKNAPLILNKLGLASSFAVVVDGNSVKKAKPDPEGFLLAAERLGVEPQQAVVFEDATAGVEAAKRARMPVVGIGEPDTLADADLILPGFGDVNQRELLEKLKQLVQAKISL